MTIELQNANLDHPAVFCAHTQFSHAGYVATDAVFAALSAVDIPQSLWPKVPSLHVSLGRAVREVAGRADRVETIGDGWVLTSILQDKLDLENPDNTGDDAYKVSVTAKIIKEGEVTRVRITPEDSLQAPLIRREFETHRNQFKASEDLSVWLSTIVIPEVNGVATRSRGGAYYVLKGAKLELLKRIKTALDSVSVTTNKEYKCLDSEKVFSIPKVVQGTSIMLKPEFLALDAIKIMLNGIIEDTDRVCDGLHSKLMKAHTGELGKRGLKTQIQVAETLETKLGDYSKALGLDLSDLNARLLELKSGLGMALMNDAEL